MNFFIFMFNTNNYLTANYLHSKNNLNNKILNFKRKINLIKIFYEKKTFYEIIFLKESFEKLIIFFLPYSISINEILLYKFFLEYLNKTYKFSRIIFNLPIKKIRTHRKSKIKQLFYKQIMVYCINNTKIFKNLKIPFSKIKILFFCEYLNSIWFFNWWKEWFSAHKTRIKTVLKNSHIKWNFDLQGLQNGKITHFILKKKKKKHNRKKQSFSKNNYNVGFSYGFSLNYLKKITQKTPKTRIC